MVPSSIDNSSQACFPVLDQGQGHSFLGVLHKIASVAKKIFTSIQSLDLKKYIFPISAIAGVSLVVLYALSSDFPTDLDEEESIDPGPSDPGPSDPGPSDPGPSDPGPSDPGPSDPGPSDPGPSDPGPSGTKALPADTKEKQAKMIQQQQLILATNAYRKQVVSAKANPGEHLLSFTSDVKLLSLSAAMEKY